MFFFLTITSTGAKLCLLFEVLRIIPDNRYYLYCTKTKNTLQLWHRRFCRNSSLQAVCDTPIARITGCLSSLRMYVGDSPCNYSVAIRVVPVILVSLCAETTKSVLTGATSLHKHQGYHVYGVLIPGRSSNSTYDFLGDLRFAGQTDGFLCHFNMGISLVNV